MDDYRKIINNARSGQIVPIVKEIEVADPLDFFARLSDYGRAEKLCPNKMPIGSLMNQAQKLLA